MFLSLDETFKDNAGNTEKNCSCQNCHAFHSLYIHKFLLYKCKMLNKLMHGNDKPCIFWSKRHSPPHYYLTIKKQSIILTFDSSVVFKTIIILQRPLGATKVFYLFMPFSNRTLLNQFDCLWIDCVFCIKTLQGFCRLFTR